MALKVSLSITRCCLVLCTSTIGLSPWTVTVSSSEPTRSSTSMVAVNDPVRTMPSRLTVLNPWSVKVSV